MGGERMAGMERKAREGELFVKSYYEKKNVWSRFALISFKLHDIW